MLPISYRAHWTSNAMNGSTPPRYADRKLIPGPTSSGLMAGLPFGVQYVGPRGEKLAIG